MSLQRPFLHEHYLLFDEYEKQEACCDKCNEKIDGWAFTCEICKFWLHKSCALQQLPLQISHPLHPQHPLTLAHHHDLDHCLFFCNACFSITRNCYYRCRACKFRVDLVCASSSSSPSPSITNQFKRIDHFCHNHKLTRFKYRKVSKDRFCCYWCEKLLSSSGISYGCFKCDLKESLFHAMCLTRIPTRITEHPFHPSRPLYMTPSFSSYECFACGYEFSSEHDKSMYSCRGWRHTYGCRFRYLHVRCANRKPSLKHDQLHEHPLTLFPIIPGLDLKGPCMKCEKMIHPDRVFTNYYRCVKCGFNYHIRCLIPIRVKNFEYHRHERLKCTDFFVEDDSEQYYCDVCEKERVPRHPVYHCKECTFVAHIGCTLNKLKIKEDHAKLDSGSSSFMAGVQRFFGELKVGTENLFEEAIVDLRDEGERYFGYRKEDQREVEHFDHEHPLYLYEVMKQKKNPVCKACWVEISGDAYGCENCDYYLHKTCIDLVFEVTQHPLHPQHSLWLMPGTRTDGFVSDILSRYNRKSHRFELGSFVCDGCRNHTCGYFYMCIVCDFKLDVKCATSWSWAPEMSSKSDAQRPTKNIREMMIMRQSKLCPFNEDHNLDLSNVVFETQDFCSLCEQHLEGLTYRCFDCKYAIHESCLGFPREMQIEYHPEHRLHPHPGCGKVCSACKSRLSDTITDYICYSCDDLHLHPYCAKSLKRVLKSKSHDVDNLYYFGPNTGRGYTLMPFMGTACIRCLTPIQTPFCFCMDCQIKWHPECVLPSSLKSKYHIHPLTVSTGFMEDDSGEYYCDICERERDPTGHVYCCTCTGCDIGIFVAHLSCALNSIEDDGNGSSSSSLAAQTTFSEKLVSWQKKPMQYIGSSFQDIISKFSEIENVLLPTSSSRRKKILRQEMRHLLI